MPKAGAPRESEWGRRSRRTGSCRTARRTGTPTVKAVLYKGFFSAESATGDGNLVKATQLQLVRVEDAAVQGWLENAAQHVAPAEIAGLRRALEFVVPLYAGRRLAGGEHVLDRTLAVAGILIELKLDAETLTAALLFRCLDCTPDAAETVRTRFGGAVADLAEGVVRMEEIGALSSRRAAAQKPERQAAQLEALRKMLLAMVQDVRVVLIKLADHTQELRYVIRGENEALRREAAEITRDIFAPLANRLGVWQLKWELEDLAFRVLEPETYKRIARLIDEKRSDRERYIEGVIAVIKGELARAGIAAEVTGRPKHIFSIYKKMKGKGLDFEALYDVRAVRILVEDVKDCYAALGLVHHVWSPIPKEFDDYIARPKTNNYRSLHTAVIGPEGKAVEIQIRTHEMHQNSELGVAAHWRYKEGSRHDKGYDEKIAWLRQILEWKDEVSDATELAEQFKTGLFEDTVYVLTPQGKVIDLPKGATPIDFAYHVHTELGHHCRGAKVDGVMVPLNTPLANGQQVEILAAKQGGPSRDWLNPQLGYIRSHGARNKIRQWFKRQNYETAVTQGRAQLDRELQRHGMTGLNLDKLSGEFGYSRLNDFLVAVGRGEIGPRQLQEALRGDEPRPPQAEEEQVITRKPRARTQGSVLVVGVDKLLTVPAKCCKPAPPDPIVGFVTRGRGVTVHRKTCANTKRLDPARCVSAEWGAAEGATFPVDIEVEAVDRTGLLRDISDVLSRDRINVTATNSLSSELAARMRFTVEVSNLDQLHRVLAMIREVRGVVRAARR
ncbi:MAG: bifunctional (p)ppGpp synthetase/guanosine-3',5'-bis(diphosphate) 3'-pyrophosphohydrolase [Betaproteobacteria bacterium]|nr:bifunctional (p)ppGpp synthetase/guanosine-3',5'-bis(diphosphate) 3'-pyrophosphohydrolase [Betaproteobacteria bacterium]